MDYLPHKKLMIGIISSFLKNRDDSQLQPVLKCCFRIDGVNLMMKIEISQELNSLTIVSYMDIYQWFINLIILN